MEEIVLEAEKREVTTRGAINQVRSKGRVPGVAYGDGQPTSLSVDEKALMLVLKSERGRNALINLKIDGTAHPVLLREIQRNPITRAVRHVDFHRISLKKKIEASVPVHVKGEAPGVKLGGGILEHVVRDLRLKCLPTEIPASLDVDISNLQINQSIKAGDIRLAEGIELITSPEIVIVNIVAPTELEEVAPAEGAVAGAAAGTEPEVIKKGKPEEGAEGAVAAKPAAGGDKKAAPAAKPEGKK